MAVTSCSLSPNPAGGDVSSSHASRLKKTPKSYADMLREGEANTGAALQHKLYEVRNYLAEGKQLKTNSAETANDCWPFNGEEFQCQAS